MKSNNENKKTDAEITVGSVLREARAKKKISAEELAASTSVATRDLERIESGDYARLPADIYVRSFLERFAKELDISSGYLLDLYQKESLDFRNKKEPRPLATAAPKRFIITLKTLIISASVLGVALLTVYFWYQLSNLLAPPFLIVEKPVNDIMTSEETIGISGRTGKDSHILINNQEVEVGADGGFSDDFRLESGVNTIEIKSVNRFGKQTVLIKRIIKN